MQAHGTEWRYLLSVRHLKVVQLSDPYRKWVEDAKALAAELQRLSPAAHDAVTAGGSKAKPSASELWTKYIEVRCFGGPVPPKYYVQLSLFMGRRMSPDRFSDILRNAAPGSARGSEALGAAELESLLYLKSLAIEHEVLQNGENRKVRASLMHSTWPQLVQQFEAAQSSRQPPQRPSSRAAKAARKPSAASKQAGAGANLLRYFQAQQQPPRLPQPGAAGVPASDHPAEHGPSTSAMPPPPAADPAPHSHLSDSQPSHSGQLPAQAAPAQAEAGPAGAHRPIAQPSIMEYFRHNKAQILRPSASANKPAGGDPGLERGTLSPASSSSNSNSEEDQADTESDEYPGVMQPVACGARGTENGSTNATGASRQRALNVQYHLRGKPEAAPLQYSQVSAHSKAAAHTPVGPCGRNVIDLTGSPEDESARVPGSSRRPNAAAAVSSEAAGDADADLLPSPSKKACTPEKKARQQQRSMLDGGCSTVPGGKASRALFGLHHQPLHQEPDPAINNDAGVSALAGSAGAARRAQQGSAPPQEHIASAGSNVGRRTVTIDLTDD